MKAVLDPSKSHGAVDVTNAIRFFGPMNPPNAPADSGAIQEVGFGSDGMRDPLSLTAWDRTTGTSTESAL